MKLYTQRMATESNERYDIAFAGECLEGHDPLAVRKALGTLFKADEATIERLFSGTRQRIKRNCDKATALKYQKSLAAAGAKAIVTLAAEEAAKATAPVSATVEKPPVSAATEIADHKHPDPDRPDPGELELLPGGSDILRPDEREQYEEAALDLSHISLAETGDRLSEESIDTGPVVSTPHFDVAAPGAQIGPEVTQAPPPAPDTSALDLAPVGEDLGVHSADAPPVLVSTEHLNLADAGSDLLRADERKESDVRAPDTSHLALDPAENEPKT
ncbi:conserved hypothetical protein [gamma proteobacterium NOR5-3]|nr:conserved hypothetical protein [gamma proteobacterium NOR5-3]